MSDLDPRALATVDDVLTLAQRQGETSSVEDGNWLIDRLNSCSSLVHQMFRRELVAANAVRSPADHPTTTAAAVARVFEGDDLERDEHGRGWVLPVGDLAARPTRIRLLERTGVLVPGQDWTAALTAYNLVDLPLRRLEPWEPIRELRFPATGSADEIAVNASYLLEVTGVWGFPSIPPFVREAVARQVWMWHAKDVAQFGAAFMQQVGGIGRWTIPRELDSSVVFMLRRLREQRL